MLAVEIAHQGMPPRVAAQSADHREVAGEQPSTLL
jgi:hypothetical protein